MSIGPISHPEFHRTRKVVASCCKFRENRPGNVCLQKRFWPEKLSIRVSTKKTIVWESSFHCNKCLGDTRFDNFALRFEFPESITLCVRHYAYSMNSILRGIFHFPLVDNLFTFCKGIIPDNKWFRDTQLKVFNIRIVFGSRAYMS